MRAVVQRVSQASVSIRGARVGSIGPGLVVLLGIQKEDTEKAIQWMTDKIVHLRIFEDGRGKMNQSRVEIGKEMLIVSQFTLDVDCRKGRRPGSASAAPPATAEPMYPTFIELVKEHTIQTATGQFHEMMEVSITNSGPVTLLLDSDKTF